jgi:hypothetical protein
MRDGYATFLGRVLELRVASALSHLHPTIPLQSQDDFSAMHGVYLYTLETEDQ